VELVLEELFNKAMLTKQGWKLVTNPCAKVSKGKYYHISDFISMRRKRNPSLTWRAILNGAEALEKGLMKCVRDGSAIRGFQDPWTPSNNNG
jgi:hypothetical protein